MDEQIIDLTGTVPRAEQVQPGGYVPVPIGGQTPAQQACAELAQVNRDLGYVRMTADMLRLPSKTLPEELANERAARHAIDGIEGMESALARAKAALRLIVPALLVAALAVVAGVGSTPRAAASTAGKTWTAAAAGMEGPQPDRALPGPGAPVYRVVLSGGTVTVRVPLVLTGSAGIYRCGSVYGPDPFWGTARVGHACTTTGRFVTVTATLAASVLRYGPHNTIWVADDFAPDAETAAVVDARRASLFGPGTFLDRGCGDLSVTAPLNLRDPATGRLLPQKASPVQLQELVGGRWIVKDTIWTNSKGVASKLEHLGGGWHTFRVARPNGASVWAAFGRVRTMNLTTEPLDIN